MLLPDPVLTASIYSSDHIDDVVRRAISPFYAEISESGRWLLWMVRYNRCGRHLKVRLHGPQEERALVQGLLDGALAAYFAAPPPAPKSSPPRTQRKSLPIDMEDERNEDYPDGTVLWTQYRRSQVTLGPCAMLVGDDQYAVRFTACMARGAAIVLDALSEEISGSARLKVLLSALAAATTAVGFSDDERDAYHAYHRDWLLRTLLDDEQRDQEVRAQFDARVGGMGLVMEQVRADLARGRDGLPAVAPRAARLEADWREALAGLFAFVAPLRGREQYMVDPFSQDAVFPPLFKVLHGLANQLGVDMLNEALLHHVLLHALTSSAAPYARA